MFYTIFMYSLTQQVEYMGNLNVNENTLETLRKLAKQDKRPLANQVDVLVSEEDKFRESDEYKAFRNRRNEVRL